MMNAYKSSTYIDTDGKHPMNALSGMKVTKRKSEGYQGENSRLVNSRFADLDFEDENLDIPIFSIDNGKVTFVGNRHFLD